MSNSNNAFVAPGQGDPANVNAGSDKGKGKASEQAAAHDVSMGEEDSSSEDDGDEVCCSCGQIMERTIIADKDLGYGDW